MIYVSIFNTFNRNEFMELGKAIARFQRNSGKDKLFVLQGGDEASGKELLALAADSVFRPGKYNNGVIPTDITADSLHPKESNGFEGPVVFYNFRRVVCGSASAFDRQLKMFRDEAPLGKLYVASGIERGFIGDFNYAAGFESDLLDMSVCVRLSRPDDRTLQDKLDKKPKHFERRVEICSLKPFSCDGCS